MMMSQKDAGQAKEGDAALLSSVEGASPMLGKHK